MTPRVQSLNTDGLGSFSLLKASKSIIPGCPRNFHLQNQTFSPPTSIFQNRRPNLLPLHSRRISTPERKITEQMPWEVILTIASCSYPRTVQHNPYSGDQQFQRPFPQAFAWIKWKSMVQLGPNSILVHIGDPLAEIHRHWGLYTLANGRIQANVLWTASNLTL